MTSLDKPPGDAGQDQGAAALAPTRWEQFEAALSRLSDRLNPILVKEARQALRSRQFTTTFLLMLAAGWAWSILGLALLGPAAYYNADGPAMFYVYYVILAAPLLIVIPYFAFSSLSSERQDRTYELVSITVLNARHILTGKLCGIALQMMVYLSALFPCLAFTYLLRGLNIFLVFLVVAYTCLLSLGLAMLGLLLATLSPSRQRQVVQGVLFAVLLVYAFGFDVMTMSMVIAGEGVRVDDPQFWQLNLGLATLYLNAFALIFLSARALLTTACQNRATALRVALVVAQLSMIAWTAWAVLEMDDDFLYGLIFASAAFWFFSGAMMVGEPQALSPRVKRGLPQSVLGRALLVGFAPGPGTGYMLALAGMIAVSAACTLMATPAFYAVGATAGARVTSSVNRPFEVLETCVVATSYVAIYLGLGKLILGVVARLAEVGLALRALVHVLLLLAGGGIPWVVQITNPQTRDLGYTLWQTSNPVWTLWEYCTRSTLPAPVASVLVIVLPTAALVVLGLNLPRLAAELMQARIAKPARVAEEDARLAAPVAAAPVRASPWDD